MASTPGFERGQHWWAASALTTAASLPLIAAEHQDCPVFTKFLPKKNFIPKYIEHVLSLILLKRYDQRAANWRNKLP